MDVQQLRFFRVVARTKSFTGAARTLKVGQSTVSEAVKKLEDELGTPLFLRQRNGVQLTDAGTVLLQRAEAVLELVERTTQEILDLRSEPRGRLVLACHDSLGSYFLPSFLRTFLPAHDGIEVELQNHASADVRDKVVAGDIHFGLVVNPQPHPDLVMVPAFRDVVSVFANVRATTLEAARALLRDSRLIVPARSPFDVLLGQLQEQELAPSQVLTVGDLGLARSLAASGLGPVLLPWRVASDGTSLVPLSPELPRIEDQVVLLWRADLPRTRASSTLREALLAHARSLPDLPPQRLTPDRTFPDHRFSDPQVTPKISSGR
jgi:DNA-binding transcriptional LysR family regulator